MMKGKFFLLALAGAALVTSCTSDDPTPKNVKGIQFDAVASRQSRATATTTSSITEFKVWAFTQGQAYMDGYQVTKSGSEWKYAEDGSMKFWPESAVDFYAISPMTPASGTVTVDNENKVITDYIVPGNEDLLYSTAIGEQKDDHLTSPVTMNFRHALSQIVFKAKLTDNAKIKVNIKGIRIAGINNKGTLNFATTATTGRWYDEIGNLDTELEGTWGTWTLADAVDGKYAGEYTVFDLGDAPKTLTPTSEGVNNADFSSEALFVLPQVVDSWIVTNTGTEETPVYETSGQAAIYINCQILDSETGIQLWPVVKEGETTAAQFGEVMITLANPTNDPNRTLAEGANSDPKHDKWMQGKKYVYTLIFGKGGGWTPDPDDPKPVLVPITFNVTVDEFQNGGDYDQNM